MAPSGLLVGVKWGGEPKLVGPEDPSGVLTLFWGHFEPFWVRLRPRGGIEGHFRTPWGWGDQTPLNRGPVSVCTL